MRDKHYLFTTHSSEPIGQLQAVTWDHIQNEGSGVIRLSPNTIKTHKSIHVGQTMGLAMSDDTWYIVEITGLTSRGGSYGVQSSTCAGGVWFKVKNVCQGRPPGRFKRATFPIDVVPHFDTPEDAEKWLDAQSGVR